MKKEFLKTKLKVILVGSLVGSLLMSGCAKEGAFEAAKAVQPAPTTDITEAKSYIVVLKQNPEVIKSLGVQANVEVKASLAKLESQFYLGEAHRRYSAALHGGVYHINQQQAVLLSQNENVA